MLSLKELVCKKYAPQWSRKQIRSLPRDLWPHLRKYMTINRQLITMSRVLYPKHTYILKDDCGHAWRCWEFFDGWAETTNTYAVAIQFRRVAIFHGLVDRGGIIYPVAGAEYLRVFWTRPSLHSSENVDKYMFIHGYGKREIDRPQALDPHQQIKWREFTRVRIGERCGRSCFPMVRIYPTVDFCKEILIGTDDKPLEEYLPDKYKEPWRQLQSSQQSS